MYSNTFVFCERDDSLSFCAILIVFALAFADRAFDSEHLQCPEDLYRINVPTHLKALHFQ
jgi:hypothetical protein